MCIRDRHSPNPFWLASAPPTDKKINVLRAFEAGWGGVVWKTLGSQVKNVSSRYSAVNFNGARVMGFNNIELISDRPLDINLREIEECISLFPDRAMIVSLMADNTREKWHELIGQVPEIPLIGDDWVKEKAAIPVITKRTANVHSVVPTGKAAVEAGSSALS